MPYYLATTFGVVCTGFHRYILAVLHQFGIGIVIKITEFRDSINQSGLVQFLRNSCI